MHSSVQWGGSSGGGVPPGHDQLTVGHGGLVIAHGQLNVAHGELTVAHGGLVIDSYAHA